MPSKNASKVGIFVLVALTMIALLILNFSKFGSLFTSSYTITVLAETVGSLRPDAPVSMSGVRVGDVVSVELTTDRRSVAIECRIYSRYQIQKDAKFDIETSGFLGDQYVLIIPGDDKGEKLKDGSLVNAESPFNLQEAARSAMGLMQKLDHAAENINSAVSRVDRLLLSEENLTNLTATIGNLRLVSERAKDAAGGLGTMIENSGPRITETVSNLNALAFTLQGVATNLNAVVERADPSLQAALKEAAAATADIRAFTGDLREGNGLVGALLHDELVRGQFSLTMSNLSVVSSNMARFGLLYKPRNSTSTFTNAVNYPGRDPFR